MELWTGTNKSILAEGLLIVAGVFVVWLLLSILVVWAT